MRLHLATLLLLNRRLHVMTLLEHVASQVAATTDAKGEQLVSRTVVEVLHCLLPGERRPQARVPNPCG